MNMAGWQVSRFYFLGTFSNFIFQFEYLLAKSILIFPQYPPNLIFLRILDSYIYIILLAPVDI